MKTQPWSMLMMMLVGWLNRHQQDLIEFLREENKILREKLGKKRIILSDSQKMWLARLGRRLGRKVLHDACCVFSPNTILNCLSRSTCGLLKFYRRAAYWMG